MTAELILTTPGLCPLPDWAKQELSDLEGHQGHDLISGNEGGDIVGTYDRARGEIISEQTDAGLDRVIEGQLRWDSMLVHPLTVHENVETGGTVRHYDNNNFYRDPQVSGELAFFDDVTTEPDATADLLGGDESPQAVLPGPYSPSDLVTSEHYGDKAESLDAMSGLLAGEVDAFPDHETLFLLEPSLVFSPLGEGVDGRVPGAVSAASDAADADMVIHTYWGALDEKVCVRLMDTDMDATGFDFVAGDRDQTLCNVNEYGTKDDIILGPIDGQNTLVEDPETIRERVEWTFDNIQSQTFDTVYMTSDTELFCLPENRVTGKLATLAAATEDELEVEA